MRFKLELNGKKYESASFADRHFFSFMAAFSNTSGLTLREMLNEQFAETYPGADQFTRGMLKSYPSLEDAEKDLKYLFEKIFPTIEVGADDLCVEEFMGIIGQMGSAYAASKSATTEPAQAKFPHESDDLIYPPTLTHFSEDEIEAFRDTAVNIDRDFDVIECWYQWWRSIADADGPEIKDDAAFEIIADFSKGQFDPAESSRIAFVLLPQLKVKPEPIAA